MPRTTCGWRRPTANRSFVAADRSPGSSVSGQPLRSLGGRPPRRSGTDQFMQGVTVWLRLKSGVASPSRTSVRKHADLYVQPSVGIMDGFDQVPIETLPLSELHSIWN